MNYPIKQSDLIEGLATDDEQATLIVIEAILSDTYVDLELSDESKREAHKTLIENWPKFGEYSDLIYAQKALMTRPFADRTSALETFEIEADSLSNSKQIAQQAFKMSRLNQKNNSRIKILSGIAVAAMSAFLFIGVTSTLSEQNTGRKSSVLRSSTEVSDEKTGNTTDSTVSTAMSPDTGSLKEISSSENSSDYTAGSDKVVSTQPQVSTTVQKDTTTVTKTTSNSSSEAENLKISVIQIAIAFLIAAGLFWLTLLYLKRRKKS